MTFSLGIVSGPPYPSGHRRAHDSALRGGERLPIRDFGDAPA